MYKNLLMQIAIALPLGFLACDVAPPNPSATKDASQGEEFPSDEAEVSAQAAGDRFFINRVQDADMSFQVNDGGSVTEAARITGATSRFGADAITNIIGSGKPNFPNSATGIFIDDLFDVSATTPAKNNVLVWDGSNWTKGTTPDPVQPLRLEQSDPIDQILNIKSNIRQQTDGGSLVTPPADDVINTYANTTINYSSGATTGGTVLVDDGAFALPSCTAGQFRRQVFVYRSLTNDVNTTFSGTAGSVGALTNPGVLFATLDGINFGYINLECVSGGNAYKTAGSATDVIENNPGSGSTIFRIGTGSGSGTGGGGSTVLWNAPDGSAPIKSIENGEVVYLYERAGSNQLIAWIKVPESHKANKPITAKIAYYSASTVNTVLLKSTTYLVRKDTDAVTSVANSYVSTNVAVTNSATTNQYREITLDLTNSVGEINSLQAVAGSILRVVLTRGTDTDTAEVRFLPSAGELTFN